MGKRTPRVFLIAILLTGSAISGFAQVQFDRYFTDGCLRLDLVLA